MSFYPGTSSSSLFDYVASSTVCKKLDALSVAVEALNAPDFEHVSKAGEAFMVSNVKNLAMLTALLAQADSTAKVEAVYAQELAYKDDVDAFHHVTGRLPSSVYTPPAPSGSTKIIQALIAARVSLNDAWKNVGVVTSAWNHWYQNFREWWQENYPTASTPWVPGVDEVSDQCSDYMFISVEQVKQIDAKETELKAWRDKYKTLTGADPGQPFEPADVKPPPGQKGILDAVGDVASAVTMVAVAVGGVIVVKAIFGK